MSNPFDRTDKPAEDTRVEHKVEHGVQQADISPRKKVVDPDMKERWVEILVKVEPKLNSGWRKDIKELIKYLMK